MISFRTIANAVSGYFPARRAPSLPDPLRAANALLVEKEAALERAGRSAEAIPLAMEVLALREKLLDPGHGDISRALSLVAELLKENRRAAEAEPYLRRDLAFMEKECGPRSEQVAHCLMKLATLLRELGRADEAQPLEQRAAPLLQKAEAEKPWLAAEVCLRYGAYADAERHAAETLAGLEKLFGPDHPDVAEALRLLAFAVKSQGRLAEAEMHYRRALAIMEKAHGPEHNNVAIFLWCVAGIVQEDRRLDEAETLFRSSLEILEKNLGPDDVTVAGLAGELAECLRLMNRLEEAEKLYRRSLTIEEKQYGSDNVSVALLQYGLAMVLDQQGHPEEAKPLYDTSGWTLLQKLEFDDPIHAMTSRNHGDLLFKQGKYTEAEGQYEGNVKVAEKFGRDSPAVAIGLYRLANVRHELRRNAEAEPLARRAFEILEKARGCAHPDTTDARAILIKILRAQGRNTEAERISG